MAKGWRNESMRHSLASRGIKTAQRIKLLQKANMNPPKSRNQAKVRKIREKILREMYSSALGAFGNPKIFQPFFGTISEKDKHYVPGDIFWKFSNMTIPQSLTLSSYRKAVAPGMSKADLKKLIYSTDPKVQAEVRELDEDIIQFLARNQGFRYRFVRDHSGEESLIVYNTDYKKENPKKYDKFIDKVQRG